MIVMVVMLVSYYVNIKRVFRYAKLYGIFRTLSKVNGRVRPRIPLWWLLKFPRYSRSGIKVGLVGCGQHAFSSIAYYLTVCTDSRIKFALDIDDKASSSLAYSYGAVDVHDDYYPNKFGVDLPELIYISSNHASHTDYAIEYIKHGCDVFIEKPVSINLEQLDRLSSVVDASQCRVYVGYNRPHSEAVNLIRKHTESQDMPFTLSCFVSGHFIPEDHWYRKSSEGTRVVANLGHWIDLFVFVLFWSRDLPHYVDITVSYSNIDMPSDNIVLTIVTPRQDLFSIVFTSRSEPFEGVNETINFQQNNVIAKVDDFRSLTLWIDDYYKTYKFRPKNNGHKATVLQPFVDSPGRSWDEIKTSTKLMLFIEEMVKNHITTDRFTL